MTATFSMCPALCQEHSMIILFNPLNHSMRRVL